jgi:D-amino-acid oxidase
MADVVVVGGGIIGLTAALRLAEAGAAVEVWSGRAPGETVSAVAAAVWYPSHTEALGRTAGWAEITYDELTRQAVAGVPGVRLVPTVNIERREPWWASAAGFVTVSFTAPAVQMDVYLAWLVERLQALDVRLLARQIKNFGQVPAAARLVVNATGLAARELVPDEAVHPVRGQVVITENPGLTTSIRDAETSTYIHPRPHDVVLGGTFETDKSDLTPNKETKAAILARCIRLAPELAGAAVLGEKVGLRPARHGGPRLEREGRIIHTYGHGGAGVTLCWGCAEEVVRLAN